MLHTDTNFWYSFLRSGFQRLLILGKSKRISRSETSQQKRIGIKPAKCKSCFECSRERDFRARTVWNQDVLA